MRLAGMQVPSAPRHSDRLRPVRLLSGGAGSRRSASGRKSSAGSGEGSARTSAAHCSRSCGFLLSWILHLTSTPLTGSLTPCWLIGLSSLLALMMGLPWGRACYLLENVGVAASFQFGTSLKGPLTLSCLLRQND